MNGLIELGALFNLRLTAKPSVLIGTALVIAIWTPVTALLFGVPWGLALLTGLFAALLHWLSEFIHQLGHAWAARRVGHPMRGIRFWGVLSSSIYPSDEGDLPAGIHIRRALGGPMFSFILSILSEGGVYRWSGIKSRLQRPWLVATLSNTFSYSFIFATTLPHWQ